MLNQKLRLLRKQRGLSQTQMAEMLCMSQNAYSNIENGRSGLDASKVPMICEALQVEPQELFDTSVSLQFHEKVEGSYFGYIQHLQVENKEMLKLMQKQAELLEQMIGGLNKINGSGGKGKETKNFA